MIHRVLSAEQVTSRYGAGHAAGYLREAVDVLRDTGMLESDEDQRRVSPVIGFGLRLCLFADMNAVLAINRASQIRRGDVDLI